MQMQQKDTKNLFKLKKFTNVGPRTNTHTKLGAFVDKSLVLEEQNKKNEENIQQLIDNNNSNIVESKEEKH